MPPTVASDSIKNDDTSKALITIASVNITGYRKTKLYIIEREIPFKQGDYLLQSELKSKLVLCKQQLMNTSLFVDVDVKIERTENELVFINVNVKERWYLFPLPYFKVVDRNFNEWWVQNNHSLQRVNYGLKFMQNNVSGRNDKLNIWLISGYTKQATIRYENPFIDKALKHGMNIGISYSSNREINYATDSNKQKFLKDPNQFLVSQFSVDLGYSYRPAIKTRHNFRISYSDYQVKDTVIERNPKFLPNNLRRIRLAEIGYTLQYFNVDYIPYPLKGFMGEAFISKRFGKEGSLFQIGGNANYSVKIAPKSSLQLQGSGLVRSPSQLSYFSTRLFGGGDLYMRGLEYYVTEGVAGGIGRATAKKEALSFNVPNPIGTRTHDKIPFRIFLKAYGDVGYAYLPPNNSFYMDDNGKMQPVKSFLNNRLLRTWGAGVDIVSFYDFVLRLEYSFNQFGQSGIFIHTKADF